MINVVTWNMQGGGGTDTAKNAIVQQLFNGGFDAICLQEMTNPLGSFSLWEAAGHDGVEIAYPPPTGRPHVLNNYFCYYLRWGTNNPRCSLAIYTKGLALAYGVIPLPPILGGAGQRPMLWVRVAPHYYVASIHLSHAAPGMMWDRFEHFRNRLAALLPPGTHVIAGDYNLSPDYIEAHHAAELPHFTFTPVLVPTQQNGLRLDYVYSDAVVTNLQYSTAFPSDHRILIFTVH